MTEANVVWSAGLAEPRIRTLGNGTIAWRGFSQAPSGEHCRSKSLAIGDAAVAHTRPVAYPFGMVLVLATGSRSSCQWWQPRVRLAQGDHSVRSSGFTRQRRDRCFRNSSTSVAGFLSKLALQRLVECIALALSVVFVSVNRRPVRPASTEPSQSPSRRPSARRCAASLRSRCRCPT